MSTLNLRLSALLAIALLCNEVMGQPGRVSISVENKPIGIVKELIIGQSGVGIIGDVLNERLCVSLNVKNALPEEALRICLARLPVQVHRDGNNIFLSTIRPIWRWVKGYVTDTRNHPLNAVTVRTVQGCQETVTDATGYYNIRIYLNTDRLEFSHVNAATLVKATGNNSELSVQLEDKTTNMQEVYVTDYKSNAKVVRGLSLGSIERLDSVNGVSNIVRDLIHLLGSAGKGVLVQDGRLIMRGPSTINSDPRPLIILNGIPFDGSLLSIHPVDIADISFLRDAVAASIWGARASNGVIVIETKASSYNTPLQVDVTVNTIWGQEPDVYSNRQYLPADASVAFQKMLYEKGYYDDALLNRSNFPAVPPVVEILEKKRLHLLSDEEATKQLKLLGEYDVRRDLANYYFQRPSLQQYAISIQGGDSSYNIHFTAAYDRQRSSLQYNGSQRFITSIKQVQKFEKYKAEISVFLLVALHESTNNNTGVPPGLYPYQPLADNRGNAVPVTRDYRDGFTDTAGAGKLLDWKYRPLQELQLADNKQTLQELFASIQLRKFFLPTLTGLVSGSLQTGTLVKTENYSPLSYYTRNLVNLFSLIRNNQVTQQVPEGIIHDEGRSNYKAYNFGLQLQYIDSNFFHSQNWFSLSGGTDLNSRTEQSVQSRDYGYREYDIPPIVNTLDDLAMYLPDHFGKIPTVSGNKETNNIFFSNYVTAAYNKDNRLSLSGTARWDASNLFGPNTNKAGGLLWSAGMGWQISNERFYPFRKIIPYLNLRVTYGTAGNVNKAVTSQTTARNIGPNYYGRPSSYITNPPNDALRWEKTSMSNFTLEIATRNNWLQAKLECYRKRSWDLFGMSPIEYTMGVTEYFANTASMEGQGMDVNLIVRYGKGPAKGSSSLVLSHATDRITNYHSEKATVGSYVQPGQISPLEGRSYFALHSLPTAGLDPQTGKLLAVVNGHPSLEYGEVLSSTDIQTYLLYSGSIVPTTYGSFSNSISWKGFTLSATIGFKLGYCFRPSSISYSALANSQLGHMDYLTGWKVPGDELKTKVPGFVYPIDDAMDEYLEGAEFLVKKADHIRLNECQLLYQLPVAAVRKLNFRYIEVYFVCNNAGILWRANQEHIDPDYPNGMAPGRSLGFGIRLGLPSKKSL